MFRPHLVFTLAFVVGALMSSFSAAAPAVLPGPSMHQGKVAGVSKGEIMVVGTMNGDTKTFKVDDSTKILLNTKPAQLVDLQMGFVVEISAEMNTSGELIAKSIRASSKRPPNFGEN